MLRYVLNKILMIIPTMIVVIFLIFLILNITPGNPGRIILGNNVPQEQVDELNHELGVDKPMMVRFGNYMLGVLHLDFGNSYQTQKPVFQTIFAKFPVTLELALISIVFTALIGIPLGIVSAVKEYSALDYSLTVSSLFFASIPGFFLALLMILLFSLKLKWLPSSGYGGGSIRYFVLPSLTLILPSAAMIARMTRASMLEVLREDYIRTARAKGASEHRVLTVHAMKPTLLPLITILGMSFAVLLGGALITEIVFGLPGIGSAILTAAKMKDAPMILASAIFLALIYKVTMLLVDILQAAIDPRLKAKFVRRRKA
jgi:peptide/nickel transport system permease protein